METKWQTGQRAEQIAEDFLVKQGLEIVSRNLRFGRKGELDIVAVDRSGGDTYVFVEVRSFKGGYIHPTEVLGQGKQRQLMFLAKLWLFRNRLPEYQTKWRIDLVVVSGLAGELNWYRHIL